MEIRIEPHTLQRALERGATEQEILETLKNGQSITAKNNRLGKSKSFPFQTERNGRFYNEKKLEVFYMIENDELITITVYVFYGTF